MNILFWNAGISRNKNKNLEVIVDCIREMLIENSVDLNEENRRRSLAEAVEI